MGTSLIIHILFQGLSEIADFMIVDGEPIKKRQKLMRNLRVGNK